MTLSDLTDCASISQKQCAHWSHSFVFGIAFLGLIGNDAIAQIDDVLKLPETQTALFSASQCQVPMPPFTPQALMPVGEVKVSAVEATMQGRVKATFNGNVEIVSDTAIIGAQSALVENNGERVLAEGDVTYQDPLLLVKSERIDVDTLNKSLLMTNTTYQINGPTGQGQAQTIDVAQSEGVTLNEVTFTTCPWLPGNDQQAPDWAIRASEISIEQGAAFGEAKHTRFYVRDVPVLYLPYFAFPTSTERQSGLLFPNLTSSTQAGIDFMQPVYWNIAPNYDLTFTPRLMTNRGLQLNTEFRYLTEDSNGQVNIEYLSEDTDIADRPERYFYRFFHEGKLAEDWYLFADLNGLSDNNYIVDLGSDFYNRADAHLVRTLGVDYFGENLSASLYVRDFELISEGLTTYRALPELTIDGEYPIGNNLTFGINSEIAYFDSADSTAPTALRVHVAPSLRLPLRYHWGELTAETTLYNTYYKQNNLTVDSPLEEEVSRTIGQARVFGALYFERDGSWLNKNSTMTLEPKFQYLFTSFEDQENIGLYDSNGLITDVDGLFRGQEFTGLDRISDNNQITLGLTSRVIDEQNREQFVISVGQIFYFEDSRIATFRNLDDRSAIAAEIDWRVTGNWNFHTDVQVLSESRKVDRSSVVLEYRRSEDMLLQFTHRFVRDISGVTIDQLGISAAYPLAKNWQWVGRVYQDLERDRSVEAYTGIEYESCCWTLRVIAQRQLSNRFDSLGAQSVDEFDNGIAVQFSFRGLGSASRQRNMLEDGMFGYRQPYGLN